METGAEDDSQHWTCCVRVCFKCFFSCFWFVEHATIVLLFVSISVSVVTAMLLGLVLVVSAIFEASCQVSTDTVVSMCPGLYLLEAVTPCLRLGLLSIARRLTDSVLPLTQQTNDKVRGGGLVSYFCQCKTTVDATSGACQAEGWAITPAFTETCGSVDTLTEGAMMMTIGEVVAALLVVIMFGEPMSLPKSTVLFWVLTRCLSCCVLPGNLIKSAERIGTLMQAARDRAAGTRYSANL